jgi:glutamate carboxypeptidase
VQRAAAAHRQPLLDTLKDLVSIETGSRDLEGLARASDLIAGRLRALGAQVDLIEPVEASTYRMADTPEQIGRMVRGTFRGTGSKAHPADRAHGHGVPERHAGEAALPRRRQPGLRPGHRRRQAGRGHVLTLPALLKSIGFGRLRHAHRAGQRRRGDQLARCAEFITRAGSEHDAVLSFEASRVESDKLSLATSGIASVELKVEGRASHAGAAPERGVNALYELSHQVLQMRDLSEPQVGLKLNWTIAQAGTNRNVIPAHASAQADVRVLRVATTTASRRPVRERAKKQLLPQAKVTVNFERRRPAAGSHRREPQLGAPRAGDLRRSRRKLVVDDQPDERRHRQRPSRPYAHTGPRDRALRPAGLPFGAHNRRQLSTS